MLMDLPDFLMHGNLYHAQRLAEFAQGKLKTKPLWKTSLLNYAMYIGGTQKVYPAVDKVINLIVNGYSQTMPKTNCSVSEYVFDAWWYTVWGKDSAMPWQTPMDGKLAATLASMKNQFIY